MSENALPKGYEPHAVEDHWREYWEKNKTFTPDPDGPGEPFSIVIPPPNVTGALHIGHALNHTLIDVLCRHARQKGKKVLWLPGTDHAGIATQNVVERALAKEGKTRHDLGREAFVERVWQWKEDYGNRILNQIRMLGDSVDWTRERFTMDEGLSKAVRKVFVELYKEGYIYKGKYIINWCSRCHTALADDEVDHMPEKGHLYHVRYDFEDGSGSVIIATTRPETIMADTGVCVHPEDERYAGLVGKKIVVPVIGRVVPLFADRYVDKEFGTGALKVTPCHDPNDWTLGERHGLEFIQCIDEDGNMTAEAGPYAGLSKEECRKRIVEDLQASGQLVKIEDLDHSVGHCYRCKTVVEPHMSEQWFVASTKLAPRARAAVPEMTQIFPENWMKTYYNWLDNIRDWCISRQIWWGHRIPAWTCPQCGKLIVSEEDPTSCPDCGSTELVQESDVLDTWFSSALWPFSTMGWPDKTKDLATFYPTSVLVTGFDILFFWVARMIIAGYEYRGERPFRNVYLTGIVRDKLRRKMSKSLGNSPDPLDLIAQYGADGVRMAMLLCSAAGNDLLFDDSLCEQGRNFGNKIWNAYRLVNGWPVDESLAQSECNAAAVRWFDSMLEKTLRQVEEHFAEYRISEALMLIYKLFWDEFSGWYLEMVKPAYGQPIDRPTLDATIGFFDKLMRMLHPFMPFVTEEIWQDIAPRRDGESVSLAPMPEPAPCDETLLEQVELLKETVTAVRNVRKQRNLPAKEPLELRVIADENYHPELGALLRKTANLTDVETVAEKPADAASFIVKTTQYFVPLDGKIDVEEELKKLQHDLAYYEGFLASVRKKLGNERFVQNAPAQVVENERAKQNDAEAKIKALKERIATLGR